MAKIWRTEYNDSTYTDAAIEDVGRLVGIPLSGGHRLEGRLPPDLRLRIRGKKRPTDFFMAGPVRVASDRLKAVVERHSSSVEWFQLDRSGGSGTNRYYLMNVTATADCLDRAGSEFTDKRGFATKLRRIRLDGSRLPQDELFLIDKTVPAVLVASDELAADVEHEGCTGLLFVEPEQWKDPTLPDDD